MKFISKYTIIVALAFIFFTALTILVTKGAVNDDTYIALRYLKNLQEGHQFSYNLGYPVHALTSPLWVLFQSLFLWVSDNHLLVAQILATFFAFLSAYAIYRASRHFLGQYSALPALLFLADPYLIGAVYCGTEMALFCFLETAFLISVLRDTPGRSNYLISSILAAAMVLTRPEGIVVFVLLCLYVTLTRGWKRGLLNLFAVGGFGFLLLIPWIIYAKTAFNMVLPTSIVLKSLDETGTKLFSDLVTMRNFLLLTLKGYFLHFMIVFTGFFYAFKTGAFTRPLTVHAAIMILPLALVVALILFYLAGLKEKMISSRYLLTFAPFLMIATAQYLSPALRAMGLQNKRKATLIAIAIVLLSLNTLAVYSRHHRALDLDMPRVETGEWIARNVPPKAVIANFGGAGAIAYFHDGPVWDYDLISMAGQDMELAKRIRRGVQIQMQEYLNKNPSYVVVNKDNSFFDTLGQIVFANARYKVLLLKK